MSNQEAITAELTLRSDVPGTLINRNVYGHFAEHLGRCIEEGIWVGEGSSIPNVRGIRKDVLSALKALDIPVLRWPGGCFADEYHWRDGIGPRESRAKRINTHWGGVIENNQFDYLRDALHAAESPVVIVPEHYQFPETNILAYDGSAESVYAIKQFAYIFPELTGNPTLLVYADNEEDADFPSKQHIVELATQHFKSLTFHKLEVASKKYFRTWIEDRNGSILVSGSFSRSVFSQLFKKSFVADIIKNHKIPVFIAHK